MKLHSSKPNLTTHSEPAEEHFVPSGRRGLIYIELRGLMLCEKKFYFFAYIQNVKYVNMWKVYPKCFITFH